MTASTTAVPTASGRPAPDAPLAGHSVACFSVHAHAHPGVMPRVLEQFAKRGLVPDKWHSVLVRPEEELCMDIQIAALDHEAAGYIARCLRQLPGVRLVLTSMYG